MQQRNTIISDQSDGRGIAPLVSLVDHAVTMKDPTEVTDVIKTELCKLIRTNGFELPESVLQPLPDRYARRLIHRDIERGYSIVAMTWGPGQCTPIHDHSGMWCVEGVCVGTIDVLQFELMETEQNERYRFESRNSYMAGVGSAGCLIPPYEYHLISNPCDQTSAVSLHIYGGDMHQCQIFVREQKTDWYHKVTRDLSFDE